MRDLTENVNAPIESDTISDQEDYVLKLYVIGQTRNSRNAISNLQKICEEHLYGRYSIEVIDLHEYPHLAKEEQILAVPTLIKKLPASVGQIIGDLSNTERVLVGLDLRPLKWCSKVIIPSCIHLYGIKELKIKYNAVSNLFLKFLHKVLFSFLFFCELSYSVFIWIDRIPSITSYTTQKKLLFLPVFNCIKSLIFCLKIPRGIPEKNDLRETAFGLNLFYYSHSVIIKSKT